MTEPADEGYVPEPPDQADNPEEDNGPYTVPEGDQAEDVVGPGE